jgi:hypothetical protein
VHVHATINVYVARERGGEKIYLLCKKDYRSYDACVTPTWGLCTLDSGLGSDDRIDVMVAPLLVWPIGIAGGFLRFGGAGGGGLRRGTCSVSVGESSTTTVGTGPGTRVARSASDRADAREG